MLIIPFFTSYTTLSAYFLGAYSFSSLLSWIYDWETIIINYERPHILLFVFFIRREVSYDWCLVDYYAFLFIFGKYCQRIILHVWVLSVDVRIYVIRDLRRL